ncbi:MAG TPA: Holliday junction resolvase RuvX [Pyrinomonadaceae bacterium]|nr:Holliday junction resolvase RuvX [Pyrinomonadaceae bacterium]
MTKPEVDFNLTGPILALDPGEKLVGAAVSDEKLITIKRLPPLKRSNWKKLLQDVLSLIERFDVKTVVIGLPLSLDGTSGEAAQQVQRLARNLARSVSPPVYLQDERLTSIEAMENLKAEGKRREEIPALIDGEAAAMILRDFLRTDQDRILVESTTEQHTTPE